MNHVASRAFWEAYEKLPGHIRTLADANFALLKADPRHPSLNFKRIGRYRSVRVGIRYRALAIEVHGGLLWFWIGTCVLSLLFAFGRFAPFYQLLYALPYFSAIRNPAKFLHVFDFAY